MTQTVELDLDTVIRTAYNHFKDGSGKSHVLALREEEGIKYLDHVVRSDRLDDDTCNYRDVIDYVDFERGESVDYWDALRDHGDMHDTVEIDGTEYEIVEPFL